MIGLRRATADDADWLVELYESDDVDPFLGPRRPRERGAMLEEIERSERDPDAFGVFVIEEDGARAGACGFQRASEPNRIAQLGALAVHRDFRGRRIADEAAQQLQRHLLVDIGYHRLELACYGFNERAIAHSERAGFVREGVKRKAYFRHGEWQDAVLFGLLREDLDEAAPGPHVTLSDNEPGAHFEGYVDGELAASISYRRRDGVVTLVHTEVEPAWEGKGVGSELARLALDDVRARGLKVRTHCPFVSGFIGRHPEYEDLVVA